MKAETVRPAAGTRRLGVEFVGLYFLIPAALSNWEQWLYGGAIFTTGWGVWFLDGTVAALRAVWPFAVL